MTTTAAERELHRLIEQPNDWTDAEEKRARELRGLIREQRAAAAVPRRTRPSVAGQGDRNGTAHDGLTRALTASELAAAQLRGETVV